MVFATTTPYLLQEDRCLKGTSYVIWVHTVEYGQARLRFNAVTVGIVTHEGPQCDSLVKFELHAAGASRLL